MGAGITNLSREDYRARAARTLFFAPPRVILIRSGLRAGTIHSESFLLLCPRAVVSAVDVPWKFKLWRKLVFFFFFFFYRHCRCWCCSELYYLGIIPLERVWFKREIRDGGSFFINKVMGKEGQIFIKRGIIMVGFRERVLNKLWMILIL